jgi:hypothetical protein
MNINLKRSRRKRAKKTKSNAEYSHKEEIKKQLAGLLSDWRCLDLVFFRYGALVRQLAVGAFGSPPERGEVRIWQ